MTKEEAIEYLNTLYMALAVFPNQQISLGNVDEMKESVSMAIKALEQEPGRDMEEIREVMSCDADAETKCKMISNILTAKPHYFEKQEPRTGHWLYSGENGRDKWTCDNCFDFVRKPQKTCPNCGARMEKEE